MAKGNGGEGVSEEKLRQDCTFFIEINRDETYKKKQAFAAAGAAFSKAMREFLRCASSDKANTNLESTHTALSRAAETLQTAAKDYQKTNGNSAGVDTLIELVNKVLLPAFTVLGGMYCGAAAGTLIAPGLGTVAGGIAGGGVAALAYYGLYKVTPYNLRKAEYAAELANDLCLETHKILAPYSSL